MGEAGNKVNFIYAHKLPQCDRCLYYAHHYLLVCAAHPYGPADDFCPDYTPDPEVAGKREVDFLALFMAAITI